MARRRRPGRRFGGFPPIISVLLFIVAIVVSAIVGYWLVITHLFATEQPILQLKKPGSVYISGSNIYFTLENVGTVNFTGVVCVVIRGTEYCTPSEISIPAGESRSITISNVPVPTSSTRMEVLIKPGDAGEIKANAEVLRG